jgi:hypothetical protein
MLLRPALIAAAIVVVSSASAYADVLPAGGTFQGIPGTAWDTTSSSDYALLQRGLTLHSGTAEISARLDWVNYNQGPNFLAFRLGFSYGITNSFELGIETPFELNPDSRWTQEIAPRLLYSLYASRHVDVALTAYGIIDFDKNNLDETLPLFQFGAPVRINFGGRYAFYFGQNVLEWNRVPDDTLKLNLNVGFSMQLHNDFALRFDTQIASFKLAGNTTTTAWGDVVPLGASLVFSPIHRIDLTAGMIYLFKNNAPDVFALNGGFFFRF